MVEDGGGAVQAGAAAVVGPNDVLTQEELLERRVARLRRLCALYKKSLWRLYRDLHAEYDAVKGGAGLVASRGQAKEEEGGPAGAEKAGDKRRRAHQRRGTRAGKRPKKAAKNKQESAGDEAEDEGGDGDEAEEEDSGEEEKREEGGPVASKQAMEEGAATAAQAMEGVIDANAGGDGRNDDDALLAGAGGFSDGDMPSFSDFEAEILAGNTHNSKIQWLMKKLEDVPGSNDTATGIDTDEAATPDLLKEAAEMLELERFARSASIRNADRQYALASLLGRHVTYLITSQTVLIGRGPPPSQQNQNEASQVSVRNESVDIDLSSADPVRSAKVSRRQAYIYLRRDGSFELENVGRRKMYVNGDKCALETGMRAVIRHHDMITVGGIRFIFEENPKRISYMLHQSPSATFVKRHSML